MKKPTNPRVAVMGCGYWGKNHVRTFHELGVLVAVCDPTETGRRVAAEIAPATPVFERLADMLAETSCDGVVVATPAETHYALAKELLERGYDVFVEKPMALRVSDGERLVDLAEEQNRVLMVGHILEYHPAITKLQQLVADGELGTIRYVYSSRLNLGKIRREENILWSFAPHDIAVLLRLVGDLPFEVIAAGGTYVQPNIPDVTMTQLLFDRGIRGHIFVSWLHPYKEQRLVLVGSRKMAVFDDVRKELWLYDQRVEWQNGEPLPVKHGSFSLAYSDDEPLRLECEAFLEAIRTRVPPVTDGYSALNVLHVLSACQRSLVLQGQPVRLPVRDDREPRDSHVPRRKLTSLPNK
jgi:predicted dehydrogenase